MPGLFPATTAASLLLLLLLLLLGATLARGQGSVNTSWYCDYPVEEVPTQKEVLASLLQDYSQNSSASFYPAIGYFREKYLRTSSCVNEDHLTLSIYDIEERKLPKAPMPRLWPSSEVPFVIDQNYPAATEKRIRDDMRAFSHATCILFKERTDEGVYIRFVYPNSSRTMEMLPVYTAKGEVALPSNPDGVAEEVEGQYPGYTGMIRTFIRSDTDIVARGSGVMQTLMFVLGFKREELRHDRDEYISLTIPRGDDRKKRMFQKELAAEFDLIFRYDSQSAAHITLRDARGINVDLESMDDDAFPIKPSVDSVLSLGDIVKINTLYCDDYFKASTQSTPEARPQAVATTQRPRDHGNNSVAEITEVSAAIEPSDGSGRGVEGMQEAGGSGGSGGSDGSGGSVPEHVMTTDAGPSGSGDPPPGTLVDEGSGEGAGTALFEVGGDEGGKETPTKGTSTTINTGTTNTSMTTPEAVPTTTTTTTTATTTTGSTTTEGVLFGPSPSDKARASAPLALAALLALVWRTTSQAWLD